METDQVTIGKLVLISLVIVFKFSVNLKLSSHKVHIVIVASADQIGNRTTKGIQILVNEFSLNKCIS